MSLIHQKVLLKNYRQLSINKNGRNKTFKKPACSSKTIQMKQFRFGLLLITPFVFLTAFKKDRYAGDYSVGAAAGLSIANTSMVEGNSGQRSVEVMVIISPPPAGPVTVAYRTRNKTATAGEDYVAANGTITFAPGEMMKRIAITVTGDSVCEPDETFDIVLTSPSGAVLSDSIGTVTIVDDDCKKGGSARARVTVYEVRLTYTGYTSLYGTPAGCPIRTNGKVILSGLLSGAENVDAADDIDYTGVLQLDIDMDICSVKRVNGEERPCGIRVNGAGAVKTDLEIQSDQRGGYVKIENESNKFIKMAFGDCDNQQLIEEKDMVPNKTIASIFNGFDLPMLKTRTLRVGRYDETTDAGKTVVEVLRLIKK